MSDTPPKLFHQGDFQEVWQTLELGEATIRLPASETIAPGPRGRQLPFEETSPIRPVLMRSERESRLGLDLELGRTIGEGGMGLVRVARQKTMHRDVAVKTLHPRSRNAINQEALMQEALISGILEHPNIVPVYTIGEDDAGGPLIVMKRIEGVSWREYLTPGSQLPISGAQDPLTWHLDILMQVCDAVHFAHSKGVIHRDLKPDNVMIGPFREVYLLDWGVAVTVGDDLGGRLPAAENAHAIAGTPAYMAPEMTVGDGSLLSPRTDIYLLGAVLHEILMGQPPHVAATMFEVMRNAYLSEPHAYPASVPAELVSICHRAMHLDPAQRFRTAESLRMALADFLAHRQSYTLSTEALRRLEQLAGLVAKPGGTMGRSEVHDVFGECRFAFQQALKVWEGNGEAQRGLDQSLCLMATYELAQENPAAATTHLSAMADPPVELVERAARLEQRVEQQQLEYENLQRRELDANPKLGARARAVAAVIFGLLSSTSLVGIDYADSAGWMPLTHARYLSFSLSLMALGALTLLVFRSVFFANRANRRMSGALVSTIGIIVTFRVIASLYEIPVYQCFTIELLIYAFGFALLALASDTRILAATAVLAIGAAADALISGDGLYTVAVAVFLAFVILAGAWGSASQPVESLLGAETR